MSIQQWRLSDRPREKLLNQGASSLSDAELLAIFFRTGISGMDAVSLANHTLHEFGSLNALLSANVEQFTAIKGMGQAKFVQLQAVLELSNRYFSEVMKRDTLLDSPQAVRIYLHRLLRDEPYEQFVLVHLDNQHRVIKSEVLFKGTIDSAAVYPRVVVDTVIKHNTAAVIFAHNHPSGISEPSQSDIRLTERLKDALLLIDVRTLDHFIIGNEEVVSFAERGLI
ncbi:RadC family protein [Psychrosphaera haliotis]|uniref:DNA repair protein RadC n=1 Tax=Psychrosphaera haliotis TaxID=555083 RepID=A0A6N8F9Z9_9GAMM|nr:DNA repair protein RadC [Psychrosphaera haliotis]MDB2374531.1 DNA repair protein RadC [Psychrosphaera haliotis]MUH73273.1 DNA repair protein RadC [Psychrosphaera haliotis]